MIYLGYIHEYLKNNPNYKRGFLIEAPYNFKIKMDNIYTSS